MYRHCNLCNSIKVNEAQKLPNAPLTREQSESQTSTKAAQSFKFLKQGQIFLRNQHKR